MRQIEVEAVFLGSAWNSNPALIAQRDAIDAFLGSIVNSEYMDGMNQYGVHRGTYAGRYTDPGWNTYGSTDEALQFRMSDWFDHGTIPYRTAQTVLFLFLPPGYALSRSGQWIYPGSGYHSGFIYWALGYANSGTYPITYAVISQPQPGQSIHFPQARSDFDLVTALISHELSEVCTDPWYWQGQLGWVGYGLYGYAADTELADVVSPAVGFLNDYLVSAYYSNRARSPVIGVPAVGSRVLVSFSSNAVTAGTSVNVTARVTASRPSIYSPTGTVFFYDGRRLIGQSVLDASGVATLELSGLEIGSHPITAYYVGDRHYRAARSALRRLRIKVR